MPTKTQHYLLTIILLVVLAACSSPTPAPTKEAATPPPATEAPVAEKFIVFGDISDDPAEVIEGAQPIVDYLAGKLKDYGITGGQVKVAASTEEMIKLLKNGEVDFYFDSTYPATQISDASGGQIILRRWKFGVEKYNSVIFASKESGIKSIEDLKGKMVAMDAPYSTSGFMLPAVYLTENGLKLVGKASNADPVATDEVGIAFAYDDQNVLQWVLDGLTPAGVTDDYNFDKAFPREATEKLVELARTESTPRQLVVVRPNMDPDLLKAITKILTSMDEDPAAAEVLDSFQTSQFDEFPEGIEAATKRIREMIGLVKDIPLPK
jgi:phosphonate transport system substrate-binding protein